MKPVVNGTEITVTAPSYRVDMSTRQDVAEEIARMYGYDNIPTTLPKIDADSMPMQPVLDTRKVLAQKLKTLGFNEAINYSFMKGDFLKMFDDESKFVKLLNPISEDMDTMRTQVFPGLLSTIKYNLNNGMKQCRFFEFASNFVNVGEKLPEQKMKLSVAAAGEFWPMSWGAPAGGEPFFVIKGVLENLLSQYKIEATFVKSNLAFLHPGKSADIVVDGEVIGFIGELHPSKADEADIRERVTMFEIDMATFTDKAKFVYQFESFSKFPSVYKDISVVVDVNTPTDKMRECIMATSKLAEGVSLFDIYSGKGIEEGKESRTFRVLFSAEDRTLTDEETNDVLQKMIDSLAKEHNAVLR
jgi:phenylalanyl-tRNA synthetase beta chain